jgi:acyl carrier protein
VIELFRVLSGAAGLAGIAVGFVLLIFQDVIRKTVFSKLESHHAYNLLRQIINLTFAFGIFGVAIWAVDRSGIISKVAESEKSIDAKSEPPPTSAPPVGNTAHPDIAVGQNHPQNGDEVIYQRTIAIIAYESDTTVDQIGPQTDLYSGDLKMLSLVNHLDVAFNLNIPDEDSFRFRKVKDVTDYVQAKMRMRPHPAKKPE